jgi:hypothetical protein
MPDYGKSYDLPGYSHTQMTSGAKASDSKSLSGKKAKKAKKSKKNNPGKKKSAGY